MEQIVISASITPNKVGIVRDEHNMMHPFAGCCGSDFAVKKGITSSSLPVYICRCKKTEVENVAEGMSVEVRVGDNFEIDVECFVEDWCGYPEVEAKIE